MEMDVVNDDKTRKIFQWLAIQDRETLLVVMASTYTRWTQCKDVMPNETAAKMMRTALLQSAIHCGYGDEAAYRTSRSISREAAQGITARRKARAEGYRSHRQKVQIWMAKNFGKIVDLRTTGLSWRRVSMAIYVEHGIKISHNTLYKRWEATYGARAKSIFN
ncbi:MAG: hypothetical protein R3Y11_05280 [Pseudomonadota bacterium]